MMIINGVTCTTLAEVEAQIVNLSESQKQAIRNDFNGIPNTPPVDPLHMVKMRILAAMEFGRGIIAEYGAANTLSGFSVDQIRYIMTATEKVQAALNTGSLYVAMDELDKVPVDEIMITADKKTAVRHKIQDYLGVPRT